MKYQRPRKTHPARLIVSLAITEYEQKATEMFGSEAVSDLAFDIMDAYQLDSIRGADAKYRKMYLDYLKDMVNGELNTIPTRAEDGLN